MLSILCLNRGRMTLSTEILQNHLNRPFKYFESVDSTNDIAKTWLQEGAPSGAVVIADEQLKGRGRKDRTWHTPPNVAIALSVILRPDQDHLSRINLLGALSVYDLAEYVGCTQVGIKWPNDVQINGKKVSGILPEVVWDGDELAGVVLGIGVNVRVDFSKTDLQDNAINLETSVGKKLDRADLIVYLLKRIDMWYQRIASDALFVTWKNRLNMLGIRVKIEDLEGLAVNVEPDGALLVQDDFEVMQRVLAGDVFVVNDDPRLQ
jgi:BirA family transcriptional regulator, biotin operon repressor / biotin---[acetyl-CoA-carboxylase] ligase